MSRSQYNFSDNIMIAFGLLALIGLYIISTSNYLLFHSLAEIFSIAIAFTIFAITWNARRFIDNNFFLILGIAYLYVGSLDLVHTLTYKGMNVLGGASANLSTQLWIAARYMESLSLFIAVFFIKKRSRAIWIFIVYGVITGFLLSTIFYWKIFPLCYQEGVGLTGFKKTSEYAISLILVLAAVSLYKRRAAFDTLVLRLLIASMLATIAAEMFFTFYVSVYGFFNLLGHFFKIISFYLIYRALIQTGIQRPFSVLFRDLKMHEEALEKARDELEKRVKERTAELVSVVEQLKQEINDRMQAEEELRKSEERFRTVADFTYSWEYWQDKDGSYIYISPSCERITGYGAEEFVNDPNLLASIVHPEDQEDFRTHLTEVETSHDAIMHLDFRIIRRDGKERWVSHYCQPVYGDNNTHLGRRSSNRDITERVMAQKKILEFQEQLRVLSSELTLAEERERRRIAIDLHDKVGQTLAMCKFNITKFQKTMGSNDNKDSLNEIVRLIDLTISDIRSLTFNLSPPALYELGLEAALDELADQMQHEYDLPIILNDDNKPKPIGQNARVILYRATRELMMNVIKHAQAKQMNILITGDNDYIRIAVTDDGVGFDAERIYARLVRTKSLGLFSIRERLSPLNGVLEIDSAPGRGTTAVLVLPLESDAAGG
ncbi:MAG: PAS domain-containing protein [Deltaproteobacteria bacterium]|nr:PAS domain-containing protein [Deltaproteobacteria bacterium]